MNVVASLHTRRAARVPSEVDRMVAGLEDHYGQAGLVFAKHISENAASGDAPLPRNKGGRPKSDSLVR
jgi:hypothetical protein